VEGVEGVEFWDVDGLLAVEVADVDCCGGHFGLSFLVWLVIT
jgi:hypothetical protein